jgi:hypothetical protein
VLFAYPAWAQDFEPGSKIDDFTIQDLTGKPQTLPHHEEVGERIERMFGS